MKHFLKETDFSYSEAAAVFELAAQLKANRGKPQAQPLAGQTWGMLFSKSSTRTRVSFEVGLNELGAKPLFMEQKNMQIDRGETVEDTARVLSRYLHGLVIRTHGHEIIEGFARHGSMPVVNALTDLLHPCQIYTDSFTLAERWGQTGKLLESLKGRKLVYYGDCANNMANSWILGGALFGMEIVLSGPEAYAPGVEIRNLLAKEGYSETFVFEPDPVKAARNADVLYTDVWVSMGQEEETAERLKTFGPYGVSQQLMDQARPDAYFMHCLPAHVGMEVTEEVYTGKASIVFDEAENRLHMQKAILSQLLS
ncbi:MAG: ornithine carbamoyltransferase [Opitutales bacterium]|nr:ornithine carbamoyltransferase [Opitutales bacterium]